MAPPLLFLKDIHLTFGGTPLLDGAELSIGPSERLCLVGRNGSGKSTLLKIAAGMIEPGRRHALRAAFGDHPLSAAKPGSVRLRHHRRLRRGRARPWRRSAPRALSAGKPRPHRRGGPGASLGRRKPARGARPRAGARARHSPARRAHQPSRRGRHRGSGGGAQGLALGHGADQPRPPLPGKSLRRPRSGSIAASRGGSTRASPPSRPGATRSSRPRRLPRHKLDRRIVQEEHWLRYGVSARRKRNQRRLEGLIALRGERRRALANRAPRRREAHGAGGERDRQEGDRGAAHRQELWRPRRACATSASRSPAATASASSARTAPARRR